MSRWYGFGPLIAVAVLGVLVVIFAGPLASWLTHRRNEINGLPLGHLVSSEGATRRIHGSNIDLIPSPVESPIELHDGDRIQTSVSSKTVLVLNSQDEFEIPAGSVVQLQLWNAKDASSPIYMTVLLGQLSLRKSGIHGKAYVVRDGRLYLPGQAPIKKAMALTVLKSAPLDMHLAENQPPPPEFEGTQDQPTATEATPANAAEADTLSNEYIDQTIVNHQSQLQKCWLTRLKDEPNLKGQILVQFEINKRGKVREVKAIDSSIADDTLKNCVLSVFERLEFQPFKGSEISLSYPINFE